MTSQSEVEIPIRVIHAHSTLNSRALSISMLKMMTIQSFLFQLQKLLKGEN